MKKLNIFILPFLLFAVLLILTANISLAAVFNVSTPEEFQNALTQAQSNGEDDVINVQNDMDISYTLTYQTPTGDNGHTLTIEGNEHVLNGNNAVQIMYIDTEMFGYGVGDRGGDVLVKNLIFINGKQEAYSNGGGLLIHAGEANISVEGCTFRENSSQNSGGGVYIYTRSGTVTLANNIFDNNVTGFGDGGGAWIQGSTISVINNYFNENYAGKSDEELNGDSDYKGGGIFVTAVGTVTFVNNVFSKNIAGFGGGAYVYTASMTITNNTFYINNANNAEGKGGGIYVHLIFGNLNVYNNIFWENEASSDGDDLYIIPVDTVVNLYNNDFSGNANFDTGQSEDLYIQNIDLDKYFHEDNIQEDPNFSNPENGNFHLTSVSPCIDAGNNFAPDLPEEDFEGDLRIIHEIVDIGADEHQFYILTINPEPGHGTVTSSSAGINCGSAGDDCSEEYAEGTQVTLTATPDVGYVFSEWSGDCSGCGNNTNCTVTMDTDKTCSATFEISAPGIENLTGAIQYIEEEPEDLTNNAYEDTYHIKIFPEKMNYVLDENLFVDHLVTGAYNCPDPTSEGYIPAGTAIDTYLVHFDTEGTISNRLEGSITFKQPILGLILEKDSLENSDFLSFANNFTTDPLRGLEYCSQDTFSISEDKKTLSLSLYVNVCLDEVRIIVLSSTQPPVIHTLTIDPEPDHGTVTSTGINCGPGGDDCSEDYAEGSEVTLTATPDEGYLFSGWEGDCAGCEGESCTITMDSDKTCSAVFEEAPNLPPEIESFSVEPTSGFAPLTVDVTCVATDPDGTIVQYAFDPGDGSDPLTSEDGTFSYTYNTPGTYQATCTAYDDDEASTTSEPITVEVSSGAVTAADLVVTKLVTPRYWRAGKRGRVTVMIENQGEEDITEPFVVRVYVDSEDYYVIGEQTVNGLAAGKRKLLRFRFTVPGDLCAPTNQHTLYVTVDADSQISETDEGNNTLEKDIIIRGCP